MVVGGSESNYAYRDVATMEETYDAVSTARAMTVTVVNDFVTGLDRAQLVQLLNLEMD